MQNDTKITVYTQTYNAGSLLRQCIESVLSQTYENFEYIIADHGSADSTYNVIQEYSSKDKRIKAYKFDHSNDSILNNLKNSFSGEYYTILDQDDWIEPNYLERLLSIAKSFDADIVNTGSVLFKKNNIIIKTIELPKKLILNKEDYGEYFYRYHWYYRQFWGKLVKTDLLKNSNNPKPKELGVRYGYDTYTQFSLLKASQRICVDNSALHHYRIHDNQQTSKYMSNQSYSNLFLYEFSIGFLSEYGEISDFNQLFLYLVYVNAVNDTLKGLLKSDLSEKEKLSEIITILERKVTKESFTYAYLNYDAVTIDEDKSYMEQLQKDSLKIVDTMFLFIFENWNEELCDYLTIQRIITMYLGEYGPLAKREWFSFWSEMEHPRKLLLTGKIIELTCEIANLIYEKKYTKKYDLNELIKSISENDKVLGLIADKQFIRHYYDIYILVANKNYDKALDEMTLIVSDNKASELFLEFYSTLSALLNRSDEFLNGKKYIAQYYLQHRNYEKCRETINDLIEMGLENDPIVKSIVNEIASVM